MRISFIKTVKVRRRNKKMRCHQWSVVKEADSVRTSWCVVETAKSLCRRRNLNGTPDNATRLRRARHDLDCHPPRGVPSQSIFASTVFEREINYAVRIDPVRPGREVGAILSKARDDADLSPWNSGTSHWRGWIDGKKLRCWQTRVRAPHRKVEQLSVES